VIEFRKAKIPDELDALQQLDQKIFAEFPDDWFDIDDWREFESYWMIEDGIVVGCSAFIHNVDYDEAPRPGCLYIVTTGVLPEIQGRGLGTEQKRWQISYASAHGFTCIVTNMRRSNHRIIRLNRSIGFKDRIIVPDFYDGPAEDAVVMELALETSRERS